MNFLMDTRRTELCKILTVSLENSSILFYPLYLHILYSFLRKSTQISESSCLDELKTTNSYLKQYFKYSEML